MTTFLLPYGRVSLAAAMLSASLLGGCAGTDVEINAPILEAAGVNLMGKKAKVEDIPDRPGIVIPPKASLPEPGTRVAAAPDQSWPVDPDQERKKAEELAEAKRKEYCQKGDWTGKGGIEEFDRVTGRGTRCRPEWLKNVTVNGESIVKDEKKPAN